MATTNNISKRLLGMHAENMLGKHVKSVHRVDETIRVLLFELVNSSAALEHMLIIVARVAIVRSVSSLGDTTFRCDVGIRHGMMHAVQCIITRLNISVGKSTSVGANVSRQDEKRLNQVATGVRTICRDKCCRDNVMTAS